MISRKIFLVSAIAVSLGVSSSVSYSILFNKNNVANANSENQNLTVAAVTTSIDNQLSKSTFKVRLPKKTPFSIDEKSAQSKDLGKNKILTFNYANKNKEAFIVIDVTDATIEHASANYELKDVKLGNGTNAQYMDNKKVQFLYWVDNGISYSLAATKGKGEGPYEPKELIEIVDSME